MKEVRIRQRTVPVNVEQNRTGLGPNSTVAVKTAHDDPT